MKEVDGMMDVQAHVEQFNQRYRDVTGNEPQADTWVWANIFGTVLSDYSETYYAAQWMSSLAGYVRNLVIEHIEDDPLYGRGVSAVADARDAAIKLLYDKVGCMVEPDESGMLYLPVKLR